MEKSWKTFTVIFKWSEISSAFGTIIWRIFTFRTLEIAFLTAVILIIESIFATTICTTFSIFFCKTACTFKFGSTIFTGINAFYAILLVETLIIPVLAFTLVFYWLSVTFGTFYSIVFCSTTFVFKGTLETVL